MTTWFLTFIILYWRNLFKVINEINRIFYIFFISLLTLRKFSQCFKVLTFNIETVFLANIVNKSIHFLYFENGLRKETKISVETNFTSFVFIYHSKYCFRLYSLPSWKLVFPLACFFKIVLWKSVVFPINSEAVVRWCSSK